VAKKKKTKGNKRKEKDKIQGSRLRGILPQP
jgi:hypothetical protein